VGGFRSGYSIVCGGIDEGGHGRRVFFRVLTLNHETKRNETEQNEMSKQRNDQCLKNFQKCEYSVN